jgi:hypothetical protein
MTPFICSRCDQEIFPGDEVEVVTTEGELPRIVVEGETDVLIVHATCPSATACPDCAVAAGTAHGEGCDVARCLHTGQQRLGCFHGHGPRRVRPGEAPAIQGTDFTWCEVLAALHDDDRLPPAAECILPTGDTVCGCPADRLHDDCGAEVWTGLWPGVAECREFGWYAYFGPEHGETGWVRCSPDDPRGREDLNRLNEPEARWDRERKRWVQA